MTGGDAQALVRLGADSDATKRACARLDELKRTLEIAVKRSLPYLVQRKVPVTATVRAGLFEELTATLSQPRHVTAIRAGKRGSGAIVLDGRVVALGLAGVLGGKGDPPELDPTGLSAAQTALAARLARGLSAAFDEVLARIGARIETLSEAREPTGLLVACELTLGEGNDAGRILLLLSKDAIAIERARSDDAISPAAAAAVANVEVELVVDLGRIKVPLAKLAALQVGDVLRLPLAVDAPVRLHVGDKQLFVGRPTTRGSQIAVEITRHGA
jgi:flagellar motor switch protein FliM